MSATPTTSQIDSSCRLPLFVLFGGAAVWLALSSIFGLIASIKFHSPSFLAGCAMTSYGRAFPASSNLLVYGFCIPAGLGVGLWILARLGRVTVADSWIIAAGAKLWHLGVLVGLGGILIGGSTGQEWLEMPRYAAVILFVAFMIIAVQTFVVHHNRSERALYPSQWFLLAALLVFPWIYSTAALLLQFHPVRGMAQATVAWWFSGNLLIVWLGLAGLGAAFYFLPKLLERPLQSQYLAFFVFVTLLLFGTWAGIPTMAPLPAWIPTLSSAAKMVLVIPALATATVLVQTARGSNATCGGGSLCFARAGVWAFTVALLLIAATSIPQVARVVNFTWFSHGQTAILIYGFFAMTIFSAVYHILPRVAGIDLPNAKSVRGHFWAMAIGLALLALPLIGGGIVQGLKLQDAQNAFAAVNKSSLMFLRISSLGEALILLGNLLFLFNVGGVLVRYYRTICCAAYKDAVELQPAGVKP